MQRQFLRTLCCGDGSLKDQFAKGQINFQPERMSFIRWSILPLDLMFVHLWALTVHLIIQERQLHAGRPILSSRLGWISEVTTTIVIIIHQLLAIRLTIFSSYPSSISFLSVEGSKESERMRTTPMNLIHPTHSTTLWAFLNPNLSYWSLRWSFERRVWVAPRWNRRRWRRRRSSRSRWRAWTRWTWPRWSATRRWRSAWATCCCRTARTRGSARLTHSWWRMLPMPGRETTGEPLKKTIWYLSLGGFCRWSTFLFFWKCAKILIFSMQELLAQAAGGGMFSCGFCEFKTYCSKVK